LLKARKSSKRRPVLTISGPHGTGKTTYAKTIAKKFDLKHISAGGLFRKIATNRELNILDLTYRAEEDKSIDLLIDETSRHEAEKGDVVMDGQLSAWMAGEYASLKIYLTAKPEVRIKRIADRDGLTILEAEKIMVERERSEKTRYMKLYKIDIDDLSIYDMIVDTGLLPLDELTVMFKNVVGDIIKN
jgi:cytidylate kinase